MMQTHVEHTLEPVFSPASRILFLGTMPSPKSREAGFYYMHPQNRFWKVLAAVFGEQFTYSNKDGENAVAERRDFLLRHDIAVWDVLRSCDIQGAGDSTIRNPEPNDFSRILSVAPVRKVCCTGTTAYRMLTRFFDASLHPVSPGVAGKKPGVSKNIPENAYEIVCLPSTSPANQGRWPFDKLMAAYAAVLL